MRISVSKYTGYRILTVVAAAFVLGAAFMPIFVFADDKPSDTDNTVETEKLHILADRLISDSEAKHAEFIGNVTATQGTTVIKSDSLRIYYKENLDNKENIISGEESIKKIVAKGNVKIRFDDSVAETEEASYTTETGVLVLSGADSKVLSGNNSISGTKITLYRTDGRITVESSNSKRVKAVLYTKEKGIN